MIVVIAALCIAFILIVYAFSAPLPKPANETKPEEVTPLLNEYAAIRNHLPIAILTLNADGIPTEYNEEAIRLIQKTGGKIETFNLFTWQEHIQPEEMARIKNNVALDKNVIFKKTGEKKSYLRLIVHPLGDGGSSVGYHLFILDETQNASQRKEINDAHDLFGKALVESKIGICRLNLFNNTGFATPTWYDSLYVLNSTPIPETFHGVQPEDYKLVENYIQEIKNIQFNETAFLEFAEKNFYKRFSCTLQVTGNDGKYHYLKLYSEVSKYDPDGGEIIVDFITLNIDDHKEKEQTLEETYLRTKEAEELKQSFIVNMSQEITTPLNAITLSCRQLFGNPDVTEEPYIQERIEMNTNKLLGIINHIVEVARDKTAEPPAGSPVRSLSGSQAGTPSGSLAETPSVTPTGAQAGSPASTPESIPFRAADLVREKVLLIAEDNENNFQLLRYMIKNKYKIFHAWNGEEAIQLYKDIQPDAILMDIKMPILTGYQATEAIRKLDSRIPIVAVTAYAFENDRNKILNSGFNDYLSKPVNEAELFKLLGKYL